MRLDTTITLDNTHYLTDINIYERGDLAYYISCLMYHEGYGFDVLFRIYDPDNGEDNAIVAMPHTEPEDLRDKAEAELTAIAKPYYEQWKGKRK